MLAKHPLPQRYIEWNRRWGAPTGKKQQLATLRAERVLRFAEARYPRFVGPFGYQVNNETRGFEFPWAYFALDLRPGMRVLEIGGGLSGMQFVLAREGVEVVNVDPGEAATGRGWPVDEERIRHLNRAFSTDVRLINMTLEEAALPTDSFDAVYSISTIEHIPEAERRSLMFEVARVLKPSGRCVLTVDLFLNVEPFADRRENTFGTNANVAELVEHSGLSLTDGDPKELYGFPQFDQRRVMANLEHTLFGRYPACAQCFVLG